ncbi:MAG: hypothetical protein RhofKO_10060 [Rhodothermales bacterium]
MQPRRTFLKTLAASAGAAAVLPATHALGQPMHEPRIACNQYTWFTYYRRESKEWMANPQASMEAFTAAGLSGYEPTFESVEEVASVHAAMQPNNVWMRSLYVNSTLHEAAQAEQSIADVMAIAKAAKAHGVRIIVTNPSPIEWGGPYNKSDAQLRTQARALESLGAQLRTHGLTLAYHVHDIELRQGAREFHHMLSSTNPANVKFCLDTHWIYRGCGNSNVALYDVIRLYGDRVVELHLRQSIDGVWSEVFGLGDIDHERVAYAVLEAGARPHLVLEQAVEEGTPHTMSAVEANKRSLDYLARVFEDYG